MNIRWERKTKKRSFMIAVALIIVTYLLNLIPNPNQLEKINAMKAILAMISSVLSLIFMTMFILNSKKELTVDGNQRNLKIVKISLLVGILVACVIVILYVCNILPI